MVKITPDLISRSAQYLNPVKEFQLDLRGYKIAAIENLSATHDQFGCIDLSDNSISKLEDLPKLNRLRTLMLINNRIMKIENDFASNCPNLENLVLTNNRVSILMNNSFYCFYLNLNILCLILILLRFRILVK
jgi:U2 small nuclear ribonucleoprotein A'